MAAAGILDNMPEKTDQGEISSEIDNVTSFEMWLDSPSESFEEGASKVAAGVGYSIVNSPYTLFTGETMGGTKATPKKKQMLLSILLRVLFPSA